MGLEEKIPSGFVLTTVEKLAGYMRKNSLWPATSGLACCAIEMMAVGSAAKYDIARFGGEVFRASPRQADLMIVAGRVSNKMAPVKIIFSEENGVLNATITDYPSFGLENTAIDTFESKQAGVQFIFNQNIKLKYGGLIVLVFKVIIY
jgi:hypothetical protein